MNGMLTDLEFEGNGVRMMMQDAEPWFVLSDVARVLDITNGGNAAARLDDDEKGRVTVTTLGGPQEVTIINESGLYSLILTSRKPAAKRFKKWVTSEVLPTLRRTGAYVMTPDDEDLPSLADGKVFGMRVAKVNAAARLISTANAIYGPEAARALWEAEPGLPRLAHRTVSALAGTPEDDPSGCFRHLMRIAAGQGRTLGAVLALALQDDAAAAALPSFGLMADPVGAKGWLAVAVAHPFLGEAFAETQWAGAWRIALMQLPGARAAKNRLRFGERRPEGAILLPRATVLALLGETRH